MVKKKRVVVTGLGVVSCFGSDADIFFESLLAGKSGIRKISSFPVDNYSTQIAGEVQGFSAEGYLDAKQARRVDPFISYGVVAGKKALEYAGLTADSFDKLDKERCGIILGSGMGGLGSFFTACETLIKKGADRVSPFFIPYVITNMAGGILGIELGFKGPNYSISTACATGNYSIHTAANHIRSGEVDLMVCGGVEAPITTIGLSGFMALKALSTRNDEPEKAARPWDTARDGFVMGEGAGVLILESEEHALARGATILAEYCGGGFSCDAYHMTSPREEGEGVTQCIEMALKDAGIAKEEVDYINAHATCTVIGDVCEIKGIKKVWGNTKSIPPINGTKSMTGHSLGAASGLEAVVVVKSILTGKIHPTLNVDNLDPEVEGIDIVRGSVREKEVNVAMSNSFGFGGHNSSVLFRKYKK